MAFSPAIFRGERPNLRWLDPTRLFRVHYSEGRIGNVYSVAGLAMEIAVILIGLILISSGLKGTEHELGTQLASDLTGTDGFIIWIVALSVLFVIGKIPGFGTPVKWMFALLFAVILVGNPNFFSNLVQAVSDADQAGPAPDIAINTGSSQSSSSSGGSSIPIIGNILGGSGGGGGGQQTSSNQYEQYAEDAALVAALA
jgi:hypothetical protein